MRRRTRLAWGLTAAVWWGAAAGPGAPFGMEGPRPADAAASLQEVVERVQAACAQTQDLSARFQQTATNRTLNSVQEASGVFLAKRPGKMRWEYQKPDARLFVTDGKTL